MNNRAKDEFVQWLMDGEDISEEMAIRRIDTDSNTAYAYKAFCVGRYYGIVEMKAQNKKKDKK